MNPVLIRIPRTGTSSICKALGKHFDHYPASKIKSEMGKDWDKSFKFTIVRDPYDRFISMFNYFYESDFDTFMEKKLYVDDIRFMPQIFYLDEPLDYIGKFSELDKSWEFICSKIDIQPFELPHISRSKHKKINLDKYRDIIHKYYEKDFTLNF